MSDQRNGGISDMKERPILFSAPMVRALLDCSKIQTRRAIKVQSPHWKRVVHVLWGKLAAGISCRQPVDTAWAGFDVGSPSGPHYYKCPYGQPGDRLWVRETWKYANWTEDGYPWIEFAADNSCVLCEKIPESWDDKVMDIWADLSRDENYRIDGKASERKWRPSIHMPRWASRINLEITNVRVERLQDISQNDAVAEGWPGTAEKMMSPNMWYWQLWQTINGSGSWELNPWVWVIEFKRVTP